MSKTDRSMQIDLVRLARATSRASRRGRTTRETREEIPADTGVGTGASSSGGSGIDSPLTEQSRTIKPVTVYDATGLIAVTFNVADKVAMKDKSRREVVFDYA